MFIDSFLSFKKWLIPLRGLNFLPAQVKTTWWVIIHFSSALAHAFREDEAVFKGQRTNQQKTRSLNSGEGRTTNLIYNLLYLNFHLPYLVDMELKGVFFSLPQYGIEEQILISLTPCLGVFLKEWVQRQKRKKVMKKNRGEVGFFWSHKKCSTKHYQKGIRSIGANIRMVYPNG